MPKHSRAFAPDAYRVRLKKNPTREARLTLHEAIVSRAPLVYCVRRSSDPFIVKIGTTTDLPERLHRLGVTADDLLCVVRGGRLEEQILHMRFSGSRVVFAEDHGRTEHFTLTRPLAEWINHSRIGMGLMPLPIH